MPEFHSRPSGGTLATLYGLSHVLIAALLFLNLSRDGSKTNISPVSGLANDNRAPEETEEVVLKEANLPNLKMKKEHRKLDPSMNGIIPLDENKSYELELTPGTFVQFNGVATHEGFFLNHRCTTDDTIIFDAPTNDLSKYKVHLQSEDYCTATISSRSEPTDGTYVALLDTANGNQVVSAAFVNHIGWTNNDAPRSTLSAIRTPDGILHPIPVLEMISLENEHDAPEWIQSIQQHINEGPN